MNGVVRDEEVELWPLYFFSWDEEAFYAVRVPDADLDVGFFVEAGVLVDGGAFDEDAAGGVEGGFISCVCSFMQVFNDITIKLS